MAVLARSVTIEGEQEQRPRLRKRPSNLLMSSTSLRIPISAGIKGTFIPDLMTATLLTRDLYLCDMSRRRKVAVLGAPDVGKTTLINCLNDNNFIIKNNHLCTTMHRRSSGEEERSFRMEFMDTKGPVHMFLGRNAPLLSADFYILVYAVNDEESFDFVIKLRHQLMELRPRDKLKVIVVANKVDIDKERIVSDVMGESLVGIEWDHPYIETSADEDWNTDAILNELFNSL